MSAPRKEREDARARDELSEAFEEWSSNHGIIWFDNDKRLAEAIAAVLGIDLVWSDGIRSRRPKAASKSSGVSS